MGCGHSVQLLFLAADFADFNGQSDCYHKPGKRESLRKKGSFFRRENLGIF